ncbi:MAG: hypothetical protein AABW51_00505 [Nanoarchaeota archaeon]
MNFIKKIFDGKIDQSVHLQFQKFSKGEFKRRALVRVKNTGGKFSISTSTEFAKEFIRICAEKLGNNRTGITGIIVSTLDLTGQLEFKDKKQFQGVKKYIIDNEMSGKEIISLLEKFPKAFFALTFSFGNNILKIKPKLPKSGKPGSKGEDEIKPDFCKLVTDDKALGESFVFESSGFKEAAIAHDFVITGIVISPELKKSNDFAKIREEAKRKGKIVRKGKIDGKEFISEKDFEA